MDIQAVNGQGPQQPDSTTDVQAEGSAPSSVTNTGTTPSRTLATSTANASTNENGQPADHREPLSSTLAKLFGKPNPEPQKSLQVSYRVSRNPDEIITVFSDPATGEEVVQFPSEMMIELAQFFEKESGVTLDKSA